MHPHPAFLSPLTPLFTPNFVTPKLQIGSGHLDLHPLLRHGKQLSEALFEIPLDPPSIAGEDHNISRFGGGSTGGSRGGGGIGYYQGSGAAGSLIVRLVNIGRQPERGCAASDAAAAAASANSPLAMGSPGERFGGPGGGSLGLGSGSGISSGAVGSRAGVTSRGGVGAAAAGDARKVRVRAAPLEPGSPVARDLAGRSGGVRPRDDLAARSPPGVAAAGGVRALAGGGASTGGGGDRWLTAVGVMGGSPEEVVSFEQRKLAREQQLKRMLSPVAAAAGTGGGGEEEGGGGWGGGGGGVEVQRQLLFDVEAARSRHKASFLR